MGACIGKPRMNADLMKKDQIFGKYQQKPKQKGRDGKVVAGESEGNRLKIPINLITCSICTQSYNTKDREPQLICHNNHTYCKQCAQQFMKTNGRCPQCRADMRDPIRNRDVYQLVEENQKIIEEAKFQPIQGHASGSFHISVDQNNALISSFWIQGSRIMKVQNPKVWQGFTCKEILPDRQPSEFSIRILATQFGNIKIGIVGAGYKCQQKITCNQSVVYHLRDGMILQGGSGVGSVWTDQGARAQLVRGVSTVITCRISPREKMVRWFQNNRFLGQGRFCQYLQVHRFVPYILLCHKGDTIDLQS